MYTTFNSLMSLLGFPYDEDAYREKALKSTKSFRDIITNSKTISGSFDKLNEDEQQKVVDSFNKVNDLFGEFFGITPERYTKDVFKGSNVSVTTSGAEEDKDKNAESANVSTKETDATVEPKKNEPHTEEKEKTLCESLYEEMMRETLSVEDAADMITEKIISILKDKKEKRYSIIPGTKEKCPYASVEIPLGDIFKSEEELTFYTGQKELKEITIEKLKKTTGSREVEVITDNYSWTVRIALK